MPHACILGVDSGTIAEYVSCKDRQSAVRPANAYSARRVVKGNKAFVTFIGDISPILGV